MCYSVHKYPWPLQRPSLWLFWVLEKFMQKALRQGPFFLGLSICYYVFRPLRKKHIKRDMGGRTATSLGNIQQ